MHQTKSTESLFLYVNDAPALDWFIKQAVTGQSKDGGVRADLETSAVLDNLVAGIEGRLNDLKELSEVLGGGAWAVKETVAAVAGVFAGLHHMVPKHPVSRRLRTDYTALALASTACLMLCTTAVALHSDQVAFVAQHGLRKVAPSVLEVSHLIPKVVARELGKDPSGREDAGAKTGDLIAVAEKAGKFTTLCPAVKAAGLIITLQGEGPFTVFAPAGEAFAKLPKGTVEDLLKPENKEKPAAILTYHVLSVKVLAGDAKSMQARTVHGQKLEVMAEDGKITVDKANVIMADVAASNGVIHAIDTVLMPR